MRYLANKPTPYKLDANTGALTKPDGSFPTQTKIDELDKKIDEYQQKNTLVKQQVFSTIMDRLLLRVQNLGAASLIWAEIC
jgi:hypothetical protein